MKSPRNPALIVAIVIFVISVGRIVQSPAMQVIRGVDMLTLFAAGLAAGVALTLAASAYRKRR